MRILITGASKGIGRGTALRLAGPGIALALCGSRASPELTTIVSECAARGARVVAAAGDLGDPAVPARLVAEAAVQMGGIDAVISNAGIVAPSRIADLELDGWDRIFAVNTRSAFLLAKAAYPHLKASRGAYVAVASMSGVEPYAGTGAYSASKAALIMLVRQLAQEWAAAGIRVNAISPGMIRTAMTAPIYADADKTAAREALVPMHRIGTPDDIAGIAAFLISPAADYVTGQNILADGGLLGSIQSNIAGRPKSGG
ncbi:MAG: SDR family oxidoreductase [Hyphomicrobiaceae bacterium]